MLNVIYRIENKDNETVLHAEENAANQRSVKTEKGVMRILDPRP